MSLNHGQVQGNLADSRYKHSNSFGMRCVPSLPWYSQPNRFPSHLAPKLLNLSHYFECPQVLLISMVISSTAPYRTSHSSWVCPNTLNVSQSYWNQWTFQRRLLLGQVTSFRKNSIEFEWSAVYSFKPFPLMILKAFFSSLSAVLFVAPNLFPTPSIFIKISKLFSKLTWKQLWGLLVWIMANLSWSPFGLVTLLLQRRGSSFSVDNLRACCVP